ncbi:MAG TPA: DNA recombination protein RmuC, partial [Ramlibacter sp.]
FVLRTVAYLWRQEDQNRNAQKIAERGAILFDKFCEFVKDLEALGQRLDQAQSTYGEARRKLETGRGNLISQAEKLASLGVKGSKKIPASFVQSAEPATEVAEHLASLAASNTPRDTDAGPAT